MMDITQLLMQQAADALQELEDARIEAVRPYEEAIVTYLFQPLHQRVLEADLSLDSSCQCRFPSLCYMLLNMLAKHIDNVVCCISPPLAVGLPTDSLKQ